VIALRFTIVSNEHSAFAADEIALYHAVITRTLGRIVAMLDGLTNAQLNWRPPAPQMNSLYAIAMHTLANAEENICGTLRGCYIPRDHRAEWASCGDDATIPHERLGNVIDGITGALAACTATDLERMYMHPRRGEITGREILLVVARHTSLHEGHCELTIDLMLAAGV